MEKVNNTENERFEALCAIYGTPTDEPIDEYFKIMIEEIKKGASSDAAKEYAVDRYIKDKKEALNFKAIKDNGMNVVDKGLMIKTLMKKNDTGKIVFGNYGGIEKLMMAKTENKISLIEYNILAAIFSYRLQAGMNEPITVTASQLYNKMRQGPGSGKVNKAQQEEINNVMKGLRREITYWFNPEMKEYLNIEDVKNSSIDGIEIEDQILYYKRFRGRINGKYTEYFYRIYPTGYFHDITYKTKHFERIPQHVLAIKLKKGDTWKNWPLSVKRVKIRTILELFYYSLFSAPHIISNKKPYSDIFSECEEIKTKTDEKRAKEDIKVILDYWKNGMECPLLKDWNEYGNGRGIEIYPYIKQD